MIHYPALKTIYRYHDTLSGIENYIKVSWYTILHWKLYIGIMIHYPASKTIYRYHDTLSCIENYIKVSWYTILHWKLYTGIMIHYPAFKCFRAFLVLIWIMRLYRTAQWHPFCISRLSEWHGIIYAMHWDILSISNEWYQSHLSD